MLGKCCQLLARLSGQSGEKIRPMIKKICPLLNLTFWRDLAWELIFKKFGPFSTLSVQSRAKFGRSFVWPLIRQNNRPVGNTTGIVGWVRRNHIKAQLPRYCPHKILIKLDFSQSPSQHSMPILQILTVYCKNFRQTNKLEQKAFRKIHVSFTYRCPLCAGKEKGM